MNESSETRGSGSMFRTRIVYEDRMPRSGSRIVYEDRVPRSGTRIVYEDRVPRSGNRIVYEDRSVTFQH